VGYNQHKVRRGIQYGAAFFDRQAAAMIRKRMNNYNRVFARFDDFIQVTDGAVAHSSSQWSIVPDGLLAFEQEPAHEICCRKVFVTSDCNQRPLEPPSHVLDKASLAAAGRPFQDNG